MTEQTEGTTDVDATPEEVMEVISDYEAYPEWAQGVKKTEIKKTDSKGRPNEVWFEVGQMGVFAIAREDIVKHTKAIKAALGTRHVKAALKRKQV